MPVHPALQALLQTPFADMLFNLRENYPQIREMSAAMQADPATLPPVGAIENRVINTPQAAIPLRIYTPEVSVSKDSASKDSASKDNASNDGGLWPLLMYFHGGGFVMGSLESHDLTCRNIVRASGYKVISVDYRLAPEHVFPAAPEDCYAATLWAAANAQELQIDPQRISVGGDSAGGNLAAVVALMARDRSGPRIDKQVLVYPVADYFSTQLDTPYASYRDNAEGYMLTAQAMADFWELYVTNSADRDNPYASPLRANNLRGLPPALVITAEYDPLRDEGELYAQQLKAAGVPVTFKRFDGMIHGFWGLMDSVAKGATDVIAAFLTSK